MQNVTSIVLSQSGAPLNVPNGLGDTTSITIVYTVSGSPATLLVTISGIKSSAGEVAVLDTYSGVTNTTRTVNLTDTYDSFRITANWPGGSNVSVGVALSSTGAGPTFSSTSLPAVQVYDA